MKKPGPKQRNNDEVFEANKLGVSVAICTYNGAQRISRVLECLEYQKVSANLCWEILLIDNNSTDNTSKVANQIRSRFNQSLLRIIKEPKAGLAFARQKAFQEAKYEFIAFLDDDNWPDPNWVQTAFNIMNAHPEVGACGGFNEGAFEEMPPQWFDKHLSVFAIGSQANKTGYILEGGFLWGAGLIVRKSVYQHLVRSGFIWHLTGRRAKKILSGEDEELTRAISLSGKKLWYEKDLRLWHHIGNPRISKDYIKKLYKNQAISANIRQLYYPHTLLGSSVFFFWSKFNCELGLRFARNVLKKLYNRIFSGGKKISGQGSLLRMVFFFNNIPFHIRAWEEVKFFRENVHKHGGS